MDARAEFPQTSLAAARRASLPRRWTGDRVTSIFTLALAFPLAAALYGQPAAFPPLLAASLATSIGWTFAFTRLRGKDMNWHAVPTAIVFALLLPPDLPLWQAVLSLSFGLVFGEQVFGGRGYSFVNPAVAALAFLYFSFPGAPPGTSSGIVTAAVLPGALLLFAFGLVSWRVLAGFAAGMTAWLALKGLGFPAPGMLTTGLAITLVHLVCDPVSGAATNPGRWVHGLLVGALAVILGEAGPGIGATAPMIFAALLGSVFAPLVDGIVVRIGVHRRRRRRWPISTR